MSDESSPSVNGHELWRTTAAEAQALVDEKLGQPEAWEASALVNYRLSADFQADWKAEVGHWLYAAKTFGFLDRMLRPIIGERDRKRVNLNRDGQDPRHLKLHQHLASALVCHYFTGLEWGFVGWETEPPGPVDIDLALNAPDGTLVEFQVKAPDHPGDLHNGQYQGGDNDSRVIAALEHAVKQLPQAPRSVAMVGIFAQRNFSLVGNPRCLIKNLYGQCYPEDGEPLLPRASFGAFMSGAWNHVGGVVLLDIARGANLVVDEHGLQTVDRLTYPCTVLLNPRAERPARPDWFPRARVLALDGDTFRWVRGEPWVPIHGLPNGTRVVEQLPEASGIVPTPSPWAARRTAEAATPSPGS